MRPIGIAGAALLAGMMFGSPASAQDSGEAALDALADESRSPGGALTLARRQAAGGDLLEAAATLERGLIAHPEADEVRFAYAALLCRLDDQQAARLELATLAGRQAGGAGWDEVRAACGGDAIPTPTARSYLRGQVALGLTYDQDSVGETLLQPAGFATAADGLAGVVTARLSTRLALGRAFIYGDAAGITKHVIAGPYHEYQFGAAALGLGHAIGAGEIAAGGLLRYGRIDDQRYVTEYGGELRTSFFAGDSGRLTLRADAVRQEFYQPGFDGWNYGASIAYSGRASAAVTWFLDARGEVKSAAFRPNEYYAARIAAGLEAQLGSRGAYAAFQSTVRHVDFGDEPFVPERKDWRFYNRAALGLPLGGTGLTLEGAISHSYRNYNAASFIQDYSSFGGELRLIWKFGPGRNAR